MRRSISMDTEAAPAGGVAGAEAMRKTGVSSMRQADEPVSDAEAEDILAVLGTEEGRLVTCLDCACRRVVTYESRGWTTVCYYHFNKRMQEGMRRGPPYWFPCSRDGLLAYVHRER
jgi:hypothetical protein